MNNLIDAINKLIEVSERPVIAVDGRCAAGKSTMARELAEKFGFGIVCMDDFFLPFDMRTAERLSEPGGNVHRERFAQEVIPCLRNGEPFSYRVFDCSDGNMNTSRTVFGKGIIVEGSYSMHPAFGGIYDLCVFADIDPSRQKKRIVARDGEEWWQMFRDRWIPMEEKYHQSFDIRARADIIITAEE